MSIAGLPSYDTLNQSANLEGDVVTRDGDCGEEIPYLTTKMVLVAGIGTLIASLGILGNLLVLVVGCKRQSNSNKFLVTLAGCDTIFAATYILVFSLEIVCDYVKSYALFLTWITYVRQIYAIGHVTKASVNYLVCVLALERYLSLRSSQKRGQREGQYKFSNVVSCILIVSIIGLATLIRGVSFFELKVIIKNCSGLWNLSLASSDLAKGFFFQTLYRIYFIHIVQVFIPFFTLVGLNVCIIYRTSRVLKRKRILKLCRLDHLAEARRKGITLSTRCLVVLVTSQTVSIMFSFVIAVVEYLDQEFLNDNCYLYAVCRDLISIFAISNTVVRFSVHLVGGGISWGGIFKSFTGFEKDPRISVCDDGILEERKSGDLVQGIAFLPSFSGVSAETVVVANQTTAGNAQYKTLLSGANLDENSV